MQNIVTVEDNFCLISKAPVIWLCINIVGRQHFYRVTSSGLTVVNIGKINICRPNGEYNINCEDTLYELSYHDAVTIFKNAKSNADCQLKCLISQVGRKSYSNRL